MNNSTTAHPNAHAPPPPRRPFLRSYFFLATIPLAIISWALSLISQAIVTARIGNGFVGPLWFAIVLQTILITWILLGLIGNTLPLYHSTLSILSAIVTVFAVLGVDRNIFNPIIPAQRALSAGWLIAAIVDMLWVFYFTSNDATPAGRFFASLNNGIGPRNNTTLASAGMTGEKHMYLPNPVQSVPTNVDAFTYPPQPHSPSGATTAPRQSGAPSADGAGAVRTHSGAMTDTRVVSSGPTDGDRSGTAPGAPSVGPQTEPTQGHDYPVNSHEHAAGPQGGTAAHGGGVAGGDAGPKKNYQYKAEASYGYNAGDTNEISFVQGEILEIADKSTKWWEARKSDGTTGLAPSNYLRLI